MPRIYIKKGTRTGEVDEDAMMSAMKEVLDKTSSIRKSAQKYGVKPSTLQSRLSKFHEQEVANRENNTQVRVFSSKFTSNQVFTIDEEILLNKYTITQCSKMHYGLTILQIRKLAYEFAKVNKLRYPSSWDHNNMTGKEWLDSFRRRNSNLSLRKPENTSAARSFAFNKTAVSKFFENLEMVLAPSTAYLATVPIITPEIIRPYPRVDSNLLKKSKKGKLPGKSRIYTDTPKKTRLQEIENRKKFKKQEQERKEKARKMKRALKLLSDENLITKTTKPKKTLEKDKPKRQKKTGKNEDENETNYEDETDYNDEIDCEDEADMSLRESSCSPIEET